MNEDLLSLVDRYRTLGGDDAFVAAGGERRTARAFADRVVGLAAGLLEDGLRPGERVAVLVERSVDEAAVVLGAAVAGGLAVPMNQKLKDDQLRHVMTDADPRVVVTSATRLLALRDGRGLLTGRRVYEAGDGAVPGAIGALEDLRGDPARLARRDPDEIAILLYTSGSTGAAKGVMQPHGNLVLGARLVAEYLSLVRGDHLLALLPLSFDYGLNQWLSAMWAGCRLTAADHLGRGELAELLRRTRPTGLAGVPALAHELAQGLRDGVVTEADGASLRYLTNSGGSLRPDDIAELRRHWPHVEVFAMYGLTEAFRSAYLPPADYERAPGSFGRAIDGVELLLADPVTGELIEGPGEGELVHAGALVARGYWRDEEATRRRFRPDPRGRGGTVVYSGDLVRRDAEGLHWFVGRLDRMLKVAGHRVSPDEVAAAFAGLEGLGELHVFGTDGGPDGHAIQLAVGIGVRKPEAEVLDRLHRVARARLPSYMQPAAFHLLARLPRNANGKVDEEALKRELSCTDAN